MFRFLFCALLITADVIVAFQSAVFASAAPGPVKREILALYKGVEEGEAVDTRIHRAAELPLNHLGYYLHYHDVDAPLPDPADVAERYVAVITWFRDAPDAPRTYLRWAAASARLGVRLIVLGQIGSDDAYRDLALINAVLEPIGLRHTANYVQTPLGARISHIDPAFYEYERKLGAVLNLFEPIVLATREPANPILEAEVSHLGKRRTLVLAATGAGGGYVAAHYIRQFDTYANRQGWLLNPFEFFTAVLGRDRFPIPDVTTVSGRRLYFSHIDGDGWNNLVHLPEHRGKNVRAADVLYGELIAPYPDLPVTVALIAADVLEEEGGQEDASEIARRLYSLPQVEVGSHTCTHPFEWSFFERYDRESEMGAFAKTQKSAVSTLVNRLVGAPAEGAYASEVYDLPRAYIKNPFDLGVEVDRAVTITEKLAPPGKRVKVYQWSGDTRPFETAVRRTRLVGLRNINGGDTRLDAEFPSVIYVAPIARQVGKERQIYAVNSNENTYTNDWEGPYFGFRNLEHTVRNTELPRRLKGFNIYYHTYSAERPASLEAVKAMLDVARSMPIAPIATSRYADIAEGFFQTKVRRVDSNVWEVGNRGALNTVRFDEADGLDIDLDDSVGVIGGNRHNGSLYVALDEAVPTARVAIVARSGLSGSRASLVHARWLVREMQTQNRCDISHLAEGFGDGEFTWQVHRHSDYEIAVTRNGAELWRGTARSDEAGTLDVVIPNQGIEPVKVALSCQTLKHGVRE